MSMTASADPVRPNSWLRELARLKPAHWPWGLSIRSAFCVGAPFAAGVLANEIMTGMWVSMGTLLLAAGERAGTYRSVFRQIVLCAPIGAAGYLAGYLTALPWAGVVAGMTALGFAAGILSSYGAAFSIGAMQALLVASIAIGVPSIAPFWEPALLYLVGAVFYAAVLGVEALLLRRRPERAMLGGLVDALAGLAQARADAAGTGAPPVDAAGPHRRAVTDRLAACYAALLDTTFRNTGRTRAGDAMAATLQGCDATFAAIMAATDGAALGRAAQRLSQIAAAIAAGNESAPAGTALGDDLLSQQVEMLVAAHWGPPAIAPAPAAARRPAAGSGLAVLRDRLAPGGEAVRSALALALCIGLAYAAHWWNRENHWFWIPLTVGLIMKPDFGSIFARSILRCAGTVVGVAIGALALAFLAKGLWLVLVMAVLAGILPWAMLRSYALQAVVLAPLVLVLVDIIVPGPANVDYAVQRLEDTVIGAAIVIAFGYFLWPRRHDRQLADTFHRAKGAVADYLRAAAGSSAAPVAALRRTAYGRLADMRARLQKSMAEPPPAGREAAAWFPLITSAERICDRITAYSAQAEQGAGPADQAALAALAHYVAAAPDQRALTAPPRSAEPGSAAAQLIDGIESEVAHMSRLTEAAPA